MCGEEGGRDREEGKGKRGRETDRGEGEREGGREKERGKKRESEIGKSNTAHVLHQSRLKSDHGKHQCTHNTVQGGIL